jgi:hypothetical protein
LSPGFEAAAECLLHFFFCSVLLGLVAGSFCRSWGEVGTAAGGAGAFFFLRPRVSVPLSFLVLSLSLSFLLPRVRVPLSPTGRRVRVGVAGLSLPSEAEEVEV